MIDASQVRELSDCRSGAAEPIGVNDLWDRVFTEQSGQEGLRGLGISAPLKQDVQHEAGLVYRPPQPMPNTIDRRKDIDQIPPGTPATQFVGEQGTEVDAPLAECLVADPDAALVQQLLDVPGAEQKAVIEPNRMLDRLSSGTGGGRAWHRSRMVSLSQLG